MSKGNKERGAERALSEPGTRLQLLHFHRDLEISARQLLCNRLLKEFVALSNQKHP